MGGRVEDAHVVGPAVHDVEFGGVRQHGQADRPLAHLQRLRDGEGRDVHDGQGVGALVADVGGLAVGHEQDAARVLADFDRRDDFVRLGVDDGHVVRGLVRHEGEAAVRRDDHGLRLDPGLNRGDHLFGLQVHDAHHPFVFVDHEQPRLVVTEVHAFRIDPDGKGLHDLVRPVGVHHRHRHLENDRRRRVPHLAALRDDDGDVVGIPVGDVDATPVGRHDHSARPLSDRDFRSDRVGLRADDPHVVGFLVRDVNEGLGGCGGREEGCCEKGEAGEEPGDCGLWIVDCGFGERTVARHGELLGYSFVDRPASSVEDRASRGVAAAAESHLEAART